VRRMCRGTHTGKQETRRQATSNSSSKAADPMSADGGIRSMAEAGTVERLANALQGFGLAEPEAAQLSIEFVALHPMTHRVGLGHLQDRLTDHGLEGCPFIPCSEDEAAAIFKKLRNGDEPTATEAEQWMTHILQNVGRWNAEKGWTMQFHIGAIRSTNTNMFKKLGPDTGYDSMLEEPIIRKFAALLDSLAIDDLLPKCIFYHLNASFFYPFATLMGSYQDGKTAGKMQLGSGWWHLDTLDGMRTQIETLSSVGLLSKFVGMLTDSRSFLSYPRHEYFRRLLCGIIGTDVEAGLIPDDKALLDNLVSGICYENANRYFGFPKSS